MANSIWTRLERWFDRSLGGTTRESAAAGSRGRLPGALPSSSREPLYERTPRKVVAFQWEQPDQLAPGAMLHVDDVGAHRLLTGTRFLMGSSEEPVDIPLGGANHAAGIALRTSLQGGAAWVLCPIASEALFVDDAPVAGPTVLADGDCVRFGSELQMRISAPDPASAACVLELISGDSSVAVTRTVLLPPGVTGRLKVGSGARSQIPVPALESPLFLIRQDDELLLSSEVEFALAGQSSTTELRLEFPPQSLQAISIGPARGARPRFEVTLAPIQS